MAPETSRFESSEMLATFLASTPLLEESWRLCSHANAAAQRSYAVRRAGEVAYVAFSGVQVVAAASDESSGDLVELENCGEGIFASFPRWRAEGEAAAMVHRGLLQLFLSFYESCSFRQQMLEILNQSKSVVFTGHSLGGAVASLTALWLLSYLQTSSSSPAKSVFCITFGSPMLGNESFSQAILQQRWVGNFCHVIAHHDLLPRLLFARPSSSPLLSRHLSVLFHFWHLSMASQCFAHLAPQLSDESRGRVVTEVLARVKGRLRSDRDSAPYWPFGSSVLCSDEGAICLENAGAVVEFLYLTMAAEGAANACMEDHLRYGHYVGNLCRGHYLQDGKTSIMELMRFSESSNEAGIALALHSSGISSQEEAAAAAACLATARQLGWHRNLNAAKMAVLLAKINPFRAEIEWYKAYCDQEMGYYDCFKRRGASRREFRVNMNRLRLGQFWDDVIDKLEKNQLTHDFHKLLKYVNASHSYKLLVEPLEIADYYRQGKHREKGHYIKHGRAKRFKIFDKWWGDRNDVGDEEGKPRSKYASLTQDSCFWARVEEAQHVLNYDVAGETDPGRRALLLEKIEEFERYASGMIERKEVSIDVLARNSSYTLFSQEWRDHRSQLQTSLHHHHHNHHLPSFQDGMVQ